MERTTGTLPLGRRIVGLVASTWRLSILAAVLVLVPSSLLLFDELRESVPGSAAWRVGEPPVQARILSSGGAPEERELERRDHGEEEDRRR